MVYTKIFQYFKVNGIDHHVVIVLLCNKRKHEIWTFALQ